MPLRFCMIATFYPPYAFGGDAVFLQRLSNMLARRGHEVDVIHCIDSYRSLAGRLPPAGYSNEPGVTCHGLVSGVGALSPLATQQTGFPFFKAKRIRQILESKHFDVIHFHNISLVGGPMILSYGAGIKLYTMHEHWLICPTHVLFKFNREPCFKPSCLRCQLIHHRPPQLWRYTGMLKRAMRHIDAFISPSDFTLRRHHAAGLEIPIVCIPYALSHEAEELPPPGALDGVALPSRPFFLFVGRLEKIKGLQTLIPLFRNAGKVDLAIAGDGNHAGELRALAAGSERIHFLGRLTSAQLRGVYARAIALLVPSITFETFGQVIIEAYAMRTPVIVRDLGPMPEIVAQSGGGLVYQDETGLRDAMDRLRADPVLRSLLGEAGYSAYRSRWTEEAHLDLYLGLIRDIQLRKQGAAWS